VVITGASSGLGRALALVLASRGSRLLLADIDTDGAGRTAADALARGAREATVRHTDVGKLEDVERLAVDAYRGWDAVDLVVNNAGVAASGAVGELPFLDWQWVLQVNLWGVIHGCHVFVPRLRAQKRGHVLNVASAAGLVSLPKLAAYNVSKAGVVALSETLRAELGGTGVGVTVLCPTFFPTNIGAAGRYVDPADRAMVDKVFARSRWSAERVASAALVAVERNALYAVPMADGRAFWRMKRADPERFGRLLDLGSREFGGSRGGWVERLLFRRGDSRR
jgi:short-subunit dehydrogenase